MADANKGHPGGSPSEVTIGARIRSAWELSKPLNTLVQEADQEWGLSKVGRIERVQEAVASIFFFATFVSIVVEVFYRYALNRPLVWSLELPTYLFFWSFSLAAGLSDWRDDQIGFGLVAEHLPARVRLLGSAIANVLIVVPLALVLSGTISFLGYESGQPNTGLPLTQVWGFAGILVFFVIGILLRGRLVVLQLREMVHLTRGRQGKRR
ncbi:MAG: TRAP transporter small permease [Candidatus Dormibacteria bacterium]